MSVSLTSLARYHSDDFPVLLIVLAGSGALSGANDLGRCWKDESDHVRPEGAQGSVIPG